MRAAAGRGANMRGGLYTAALIGCGRISFKHIEGFIANADRLTLAAVCDPADARARKKAEDYIVSSPRVSAL
jgi:predicted dehydrogenase